MKPMLKSSLLLFASGTRLAIISSALDRGPGVGDEGGFGGLRECSNRAPTRWMWFKSGRSEGACKSESKRLGT